MLCSRSRGIHLLRGVAAISLLLASPMLEDPHPMLMLFAVAGAFVLFRGCPMCWLVGFFETWAGRRDSACESTSSTSI